MKKVFCLFISIVLLFSACLIVNAKENFVTANGFTLNVSTGCITSFDISGYNGGNDVIIPNSVNGNKVVGIGGFAFQTAFDDLAGDDWILTDEEASVRKIYVPNSITVIESGAFYTGFVGTAMTVCCEKTSYAYEYINDGFKDSTGLVMITVDSVAQIDLQADAGSVPDENTEIPIEQSPKMTTSFGAQVSTWAAPEIEEAFKNNLIPEVMLDFDLTKKVNRGEFAAIAVQLYEVLAKQTVEESPSCTFADIQYDDNEKAIKKAYQIEVAQGISDTTYEPLSFINREQLATMLCRVIKKYSYPNWTMENDADYYMDTTGVQKFADDVDISEWAKPSVYFMAKFGIVQGVSDTHFAPKNTTSQQEASDYASATREQAIILAQRIFKISDVFGN